MANKELNNILDLFGFKEIEKNSLEYDILMTMYDDSKWLEEMKKEHNFYELCRQLEMAGFERNCSTCYYNQLRLGKKEHGIL